MFSAAVLLLLLASAGDASPPPAVPPAEHDPPSVVLATARDLAAAEDAASWQQAARLLEGSLPRIETELDVAGQLEVRSLLSEVRFKLGRRREALAAQQQGLALARSTHQTTWEAKLILQEITTLVFLGEVDPARAELDRALALHQRLGDLGGESECWLVRGMIALRTGDRGGALPHLERSLALARQSGRDEPLARAWNGLGLAFRATGHLPEALDALERSVELFRRLGKRADEAAGRSNLGRALIAQGRPRDAVRQLEPALALLERIGDPSSQATSLLQLAQAQLLLGEAGTALASLDRALARAREAEDPYVELQASTALARLYGQLGDWDAADAVSERALVSARALDQRYSEAALLADRGRTLLARGRPGDALDLFEAVLPRLEAAKDRFAASDLLARIGEAHAALGDWPQAVSRYRASLARRLADDDRAGEVDARIGLCLADAARGDAAGAEPECRRAAGLARELGLSRALITALSSLARVELDAGRLAGAAESIEEALARVERTRGNVPAGLLRSTYLASSHSLYELEIEILMRRASLDPAGDFVQRAFEAAEASRARSLLDALAVTGAELRRASDDPLLRREAELRNELDRLERARAWAETQREGQATLPELAAETDRLLVQLHELGRRIQAASPRYATLTQPRPLGLQELRREVLDESTAVLEIVLGERRSFLFWVTHRELGAWQLPPRSTLARIAFAARDLVAARGERISFETEAERTQRVADADSRLPGVLSELSQVLLSPLGDRLAGQRLLIVSTESLQQIPFAALSSPTSGRALIEDHEIVILPSASVLAEVRRQLARRAPAPAGLAVFADPVFDRRDGRVTGSGTHQAESAREEGRAELIRSATELGLIREGLPLPRLPASRREADTILRLAAEPSNLLALDFEASLATLRAAQPERFRILHFATHALINERHPELSGIVLSLVDRRGRDVPGFLRLYEVADLELGADLVVLSACRTALGKDLPGEGLISLVRGFFHAGVPRVMASLWNGEDEAGADLMVHFYRGLLTRGLSPAAALRQAQRRMMQGPRWRHPYYWASVVLEGEYR